MSRYMIICAQDPFEGGGGVRGTCEIAADLCAGGHDTAVYLIQNGVLAANEKADAKELDDLIAAGAKVLADDFSLRERALSGKALRRGIETGTIEQVVDALADGTKVFWY